MISLPDFKEKQILFVTADWGVPSRLSFRNDNIVFEKERKVVNKVSVHKTFSIFICGDLSLTTNFLKQSRKYGVSIFFLKNNFELYSSLMSIAEGHYVLRMKQYDASEENQLNMAKNLILNKIKNQVFLLKENNNSKEKEKIKRYLNKFEGKIKNAKDYNEILGIEGNFSRYYFSEMFRNYSWRRRAPRTKEDITNFLMDMGYTFLFNFTDSLLRLHGFDTYKGFYHRLFFQRRSLACDIMEVFRPLIDKQIIKSYNLGQIKEEDFKVVNGAYSLPFENYSKYSQIFLGCLMDKKEYIFSYINEYYKFVMDDQKNNFPDYSIKI